MIIIPTVDAGDVEDLEIPIQLMYDNSHDIFLFAHPLIEMCTVAIKLQCNFTTVVCIVCYLSFTPQYCLL